MPRYTYYFLLNACCLLLNAAPTFAQIGSSNSIQISDSLHVWSMPSTEPYTYNYVSINNSTGSDLNVDFRVLLPSTLPSNWRVRVEYPKSGGYVDTLNGNFEIFGDNSGQRFFFLSVISNGQVGMDTMRVRLYPQNNPADSVEVLFVLNVVEPVAVTEQTLAPKTILYPNPTKEAKIYWTGTQLSPALAYIYSAQGQIVALLPIESGTIELPNSLPAAAYWIQIRDARTLQIIDTQPFIRL